jgi:hypothetical protein
MLVNSLNFIGSTAFRFEAEASCGLISNYEEDSLTQKQIA